MTLVAQQLHVFNSNCPASRCAAEARNSSGSSHAERHGGYQEILPDEAAVVVPNSTIFRQLQHVDVQQAAIDEAKEDDQHQANAECHFVRVKIRGAPVAMEVNISDIRSALGLPIYYVRSPFKEPTAVSTPAPASDMEDT
ncbi:hypothetical protein GN958_ATG10149 [Phytophthora infestans]|uniref:Uncharacterized protein n=1 Tax=Phytophthora infestans TaxID=4787 RepID=A0A8S9UI42_PHYIN|nr:hypothetical protein GN958_ATG10147 [Phytophthora infestans]KAF4140657.1 hypothetical protein GN958_ATG10149 [Phytophthora infestans]